MRISGKMVAMIAGAIFGGVIASKGVYTLLTKDQDNESSSVNDNYSSIFNDDDDDEDDDDADDEEVLLEVPEDKKPETENK